MKMLKTFCLVLFVMMVYSNNAVARYVTSDPIGLRGGMNTYSYVNNNPIIYIDPLGLTKLTFDPTGNSLWVNPEVDGRPTYVIDATSGKPNTQPNQVGLGPIPSGNWNLNKDNISNPSALGDLLRKLHGDWGDWRVPLKPNSDTVLFDRDPNSFFIHGGQNPGTAGCIDVGGGLFGNSLTDQLLTDIMNDPDGIIPLHVQ